MSYLALNEEESNKQTSTITFRIPSGEAALAVASKTLFEVHKDGQVFVNGELVDCNKKIYYLFQRFLYSQKGLDQINIHIPKEYADDVFKDILTKG